MPESSAMLTLPVAVAAARALPSAFSANVAPSSGGSSTSSGSASISPIGQQPRELAALVLVARGEQEPWHRPARGHPRKAARMRVRILTRPPKRSKLGMDTQGKLGNDWKARPPRMAYYVRE